LNLTLDNGIFSLQPSMSAVTPLPSAEASCQMEVLITYPETPKVGV
jgi:hypothetical protein